MQVYTVPGMTARPGCKTGDGQWQSREVHNTIWTEENSHWTQPAYIHSGGAVLYWNAV